MFKKISLVLILILLFLMSACSKESKFGIAELSARMEETHGVVINADSFMLGKDQSGNTYLFSEIPHGLITVFPDSDNKIHGISLLADSEANIENTILLFSQLCTVFTGADSDEQNATLKNCGITAESIKFTDSSAINTVGKYKYVAVCNQYSVTLFCERV